MAGKQQQESDPAVVAYLNEVEELALRGPREGYVRLEERRRQARKEGRLRALQAWEAARVGAGVDLGAACIQARARGVIARRSRAASARALTSPPGPGM